MRAWGGLIMLTAAITAPTIERNDFLRMIPTVDAFRIDVERQHIKIGLPPGDDREGSP